MRAFAKALCLAAACSAPACALAEAQRLPRLMSTNICADVLALSLADPAQIVSLSRQSQDAKRFSQAVQARRFVANDATTEDVLQLQPDVVLASRRWNARRRTGAGMSDAIRRCRSRRRWSGSSCAASAVAN